MYAYSLHESYFIFLFKIWGVNLLSIWEIILIAVGLSMDAVAISMSNCLVYNNRSSSAIWLQPIFFGGFQFLMPIIGYLLGSTVAAYISDYTGYIVFVILTFIGAKIIYDTIKHPCSTDNGDCSDIRYTTLFVQGITTSIDALAVGISFSLLSVNIFLSSSLIGIITAVFCVLGTLLGKKFCTILGDKSKFIGGGVLIAIGIKSIIV